MSENVPESTEQATEQQPQEGGEVKTFTEDYVKQLRSEAAKHRTEARAAAAELEKLRTASLSESEKAVAEAEQRGRLSAATEFGQRLARSAFVAEAARRNPGYDAAAVLDDLNLARYVGEDGEPDSKAIAKAVERLVPAVEQPSERVPSFDGGVRTTHVPNSTADQFAKAVESMFTT